MFLSELNHAGDAEGERRKKGSSLPFDRLIDHLLKPYVHAFVALALWIYLEAIQIHPLNICVKCEGRRTLTRSDKVREKRRRRDNHMMKCSDRQ